MKMKLKSMPLLIGVVLAIVAGCQKNENLVSPDVKSAPDEKILQSNESPKPVNIVLARGVFTATGGLEANGSYIMSPVIQRGNSFECTNIFVTEGGTITALSYCQMGSWKGAWRIVSGSGVYENIEGNGTLVMEGGTEVWDGKIF